MKSFVNKSPKEKGSMQTLYFNPTQTKEILLLAGDAGLVLMQHYVAIAHQPNPNMEDDVLAAMLCKSPKAVERTRLALTKGGWFRRIKKKHNREDHIMYVVGKSAVQEYDSSSSAMLKP